MFISTSVTYALVAVVVLIFIRQLFVLYREKETRGQLSLFEKASKKKVETFDEKMELRKRMIVDMAHEKGGVTNNEVEQLFAVSHTTAWRYLEELEREGRIVQSEKTGRGVIYTSAPGAF